MPQLDWKLETGRWIVKVCLPRVGMWWTKTWRGLAEIEIETAIGDLKGGVGWSYCG
jgi:hypothetical protein